MSTPIDKKVLFNATLEDLENVLCWIRHTLLTLDFSAEEKRRIELAMEEALVNIITHSKPKMIELSGRVFSSRQVEFIIQDDAPPFNPLLIEEKTHHVKSLEKKQEGGLGIMLMKKCMDELIYERKEPYNILRLIKN